MLRSAAHENDRLCRVVEHDDTCSVSNILRETIIKTSERPLVLYLDREARPWDHNMATIITTIIIISTGTIFDCNRTD